MRALIRGPEIYPESEWTVWTRNNIFMYTEYWGWELVEDWEPTE